MITVDDFVRDAMTYRKQANMESYVGELKMAFIHPSVIAQLVADKNGIRHVVFHGSEIRIAGIQVIEDPSVEQWRFVVEQQ